MRDVREELNRLREKLRRMESRALDRADQPTPMDSPESIPPSAELPPWESAESEAQFEKSLQVELTMQSAPLSYRGRGEIDSCLSGRLVETQHGKHFETETLYPRESLHGAFDVAELQRLPGDLIHALCPEHSGQPIQNWVFLDTETNGLAGGAGTFAFLIGLGFVTEQGFLVRQYFLREPCEEASVLSRLSEDLRQFSTVITYNGKSYDLPLLETRFRLARSPIPFEEMPHLDLLHACRRLWKLRFESCKLTFLEERILGHERVGDVPGFLIPSLYSNYLRTREAGSLVPIFTHNALDILSLACLTSVVGAVFTDPGRIDLRHGAEYVGLGRWLLQAGRREEARSLLRRAVNTTIPEDLLARTLWDIFQIERQDCRFDEAKECLEQIIGFPNVYHAKAFEALSILYEHRLKDLNGALQYARKLEAIQPGEKAGGRLERLVKKLGKSGRGRFFETA